jgi:hypothetical protein
MKLRIICLLTLFAMSLGMAACGERSTPAPPTPTLAPTPTTTTEPGSIDEAVDQQIQALME